MLDFTVDETFGSQGQLRMALQLGALRDVLIRRGTWLFLLFCMLPPIGALLCLYLYFSWSKEGVYWAGYILQLPTMAAAFIGFWETPKIIGNTTLLALLSRIFRNSPPTKKPFVADRHAFIEFGAEVDKESPSIERRVEILETKTSSLETRVTKLHDRHEGLRSEVETLRGYLSAQHQEILSKLERALLDSLPIATVSILWLVVGLTMSTCAGSPQTSVCGI